MLMNKIEKANKEAVNRMIQSQPVLKGIKRAGDVLDGLDKHVIYHAGPPIEWEDMCGPLRGAVIGAMKYEGWADDEDEAVKLIEAGEIKFDSNHHHNAVGPMTGIISQSMPVFEVENTKYGNVAYSTINEGIGKVMRFGANGPEVLNRLHWLEDEFAPVMDKVIEKTGGVNLKNVISKALAMGDEMHQRNIAASLIFYKEVCGELAEVLRDYDNDREIVEFIIKKNDQFFLNLAMAAGKAIMDSVRGIEYSTVVTAMSRNGTDFGINVSGLDGEWYTAPVKKADGLFFPGYSEEDANLDIGDSTILECIGIGGFAMGSAPAVVNFIGAGSVDKAVEYSKNMGKITVDRNSDLAMPNMNFLGAASGIDIRKVVDRRILPVINTGIAHKEAGVGQVGAGIVNPPVDIFEKALIDYAEKYNL